MGFVIDKIEAIAIYGGGKVGKSYAERLIAEGYNVVGIIDRMPAGVKSASVPVFTLDEYYSRFGNTFIWVSLGSGLQHTAVAKILNRKGFSRILFLPIQLRSMSSRRMIESFNSFITGNYEFSIPYYDELFTCNPYEYILSGCGEFITAMVPVEHVYSANPESALDDKNQNPYNVLFAYNSQRKEDYSGYNVPIASLDYMAEVSSRKYGRDYDEMYENALFDFEFFISGASAVSLENNNKFNIIDGGHRALFLASKGFKGIPCRISKSDWVKYFKQDSAQRLMDYVKELNFLPRKVIHPAFMFFSVNEREPDSEFIRLYEELCE